MADLCILLFKKGEGDICLICYLNIIWDLNIMADLCIFLFKKGEGGTFV